LNLDSVAFGPFHRRLLVYTNIGLFCDGYILSTIGLALTTLGPRLNMSDAMTGFVGAVTLLGILLGALVFGYLSDRVGRRKLMIGDLAVFVVACLLQGFINQVWQILILRFVLGVAIGADYPLAASLTAEFMPTKLRGKALNSLQMTWFAGAALAYVFGNALLSLGLDSWRWILMSPALFAGIGLLLRASAPESPRWLASQGRIAEARTILSSLGYPAHEPINLPSGDKKWSSIFAPTLRSKLGFVSMMWLLQVVPLFAMLTFAPRVLTALHLGSDTSSLGSVAITAAFFVGSVISTPLIESWGRRPLCIYSFAVAGISFAIIATNYANWMILAFAMYAIALGAAAGLELVYPAELFPTAVRGSATGFAAAVSRVGAFVGTFMVPIVLARYGPSALVLSALTLSVLGLLLAITCAPETREAALD
jgi:MFS transporter, putative metabolite transport protein